jgi:CBS domain-containing protein
MLVKDLMTENVLSVSFDDTVSNALSIMKKYSIHQLPVIDDNELKGMLLLKKIITKDIDPSITKAGHLAVSTPVLDPDEDVEDASRKILQSDMRAMPVVDRENVVGILSETDLLRLIDKDHAINKIMTKCEYLTTDDDIGKVKKIMAYENISRIPVLDKGNVVGVIGTLDLIDVVMKARQPLDANVRSGDKGFKEPSSIDKIKLETIMKKPAIIDKNASIKEVAKLLMAKEEVIIKNDNEFCIVTPKDILEVIAKPEKGVYVQIINLGKEDPFIASKIDDSTTKFVQKIGKEIENIQALYLYIERHEKLGKIKYSVRTRFLTPIGMFVSKAWGWELVTVTQEAMNKLEREVLKKYGKRKQKFIDKI